MKILKKIFLKLKTPYLLIKKTLKRSIENVNVYKYTAITKDNKKETDYISINKNIINNFLIVENKKIINIKTNKFIMFLHRNINKKEISKKELVYFLTQINIYLNAQNNLITSLSLVIKNCKYKNLERILRVVRYDLMCGNDLSDSLNMQGKSFPKLLIKVLKDKSVDESIHLLEMEDYYKTIYINNKNSIKLNLYKIFIIPYIIMTTTFIMGYIIPKFYNLYKLFLDEELEFLKVFINLKKYDSIIFKIFIILVFIYIMILLLSKIPKIKKKLIILYFNINKSTIHKEMIIYSKTIGLIIKYNINEENILKNTTDNYYYQKLLEDSYNEYQLNRVISPTLEDKKYFETKALNMIISGEKFDSLLLQINNISNYYQTKIDKNKKIIMNIIGPLIIIQSTLLFGSIILLLLFDCLMIIK